METTNTYVLIHGSWHDGNAWNRVGDALRAMGHDVHAPTLAGHGADGNRSVSHEDIVSALVEHIEKYDLRDIVLVGHSFGGSVLQRVAEEVSARVRHMVFVCAYVVKDGESVQDNFPAVVRDIIEQTVEPDGGVPLGFDLFRHGLFNDGSDEEAARAYEDVHPTPVRSLTDKVTLRDFFALDIPRSFVHFMDDVSIPADSEYYLLTRQAPRLGAHDQRQISGGHDALITNSAALTDVIVELTVSESPRN